MEYLLCAYDSVLVFLTCISHLKLTTILLLSPYLQEHKQLSQVHWFVGKLGFSSESLLCPFVTLPETFEIF